MRRKKKGRDVTNVNNIEVDKSRVKFKASQSASAHVGQGGNAFAINANELGDIRVRAGQQR